MRDIAADRHHEPGKILRTLAPLVQRLHKEFVKTILFDPSLASLTEEDLAKQGVIFTDTDTAVKEHPDLLIVCRARDVQHAAQLYRAGASHAVPETLESSLQLSEAVLVDIGVAMGPVIASIHEKRDEFRGQIEQEGALAYKPKLRTSTAEG